MHGISSQIPFYEKGIALNSICFYVGKDNMVKFLLENGADVNRPNNYEATPLHMAAENG